MRFRSFVALAGVASILSACSSGPGAASLDTDDQKASYGIGLQMGAQLSPAEGRLDVAAFMKGIEDAMAGADPAIPEDEVMTALQTFSQSINEAEQAKAAALAEKNIQESEAYFAENGAREGVVTTESGLQYEMLREGDGASPTPANTVRIHYKGSLIDGTEFDSSYGGEPAEFSVGGVIAGFTEALELMNVGGHIRVSIPGDLAYGAQGSGQVIGPNATLIFEIELLDIVE